MGNKQQIKTYRVNKQINNTRHLALEASSKMNNIISRIASEALGRTHDIRAIANRGIRRTDDKTTQAI